jgi:alkylation response protein AidB-like acyl-CoA dehydrogenase
MNDTDLTTAPAGARPDIGARAREMADLARGMADQIEADRRLPAELVSALRDSGLLRAGAPVEVGALELAPGTALRCAEEVARGDASAGWCVSIAITSSLLVAYLPPVSRDELFGAGRGVAAGVWAPQGKARSAPGGVVVSGRWAFCSGITHADVLFAACITAAAMGNARAAIDNFVELAGAKKSGASSRTLAERPTVQAAVAAAESALEAARTLYYHAIETAWRAAQDEPMVPVEARTRLRLAATHGVRTAADVVRTMYDLAGGSAIYDGAPLQRRFRDAFTATAHFQVNQASYELPGRILLNQPTEAAML